MYLSISYRKDKNYYQVFLEEFKHVHNEKKRLSSLLTKYKFFLMILIKKILMKNMKYGICF